MSVLSINNGTIVPIEYSHMHDSGILFRKYREVFDFGLSINNYYINKNPKDKKTNYNTQYTLTNLQPLSTLVELDIPYTKYATSKFTTTIKLDTSFLKTNFTDYADGRSELEVSSMFSNLSSGFFYTFTITSFPTGIANIDEERIIISSEEIIGNQSTTWYLSAPKNQNTYAKWTSSAPTIADQTFRFTLEDNTLIIFSNPNNLGIATGNIGAGNIGVGIGSTTVNIATNVAVISNNELYWRAPGTWQSTASELSAGQFTVNRKNLTKDNNKIPNSYVKYTSSYNADIVDLNTSTVTENISNNYFVYSNNYNFYHNKDSEQLNTVSVHADLFALKNQATLHEYYAENNHFNSEPNYLNRVYEKIHGGTNQQRGYEKIGLSYNIGTYDMNFKPSKLTYFTTPNSLAPYTVLNIKDARLEKLGAIAGDSPLLSDKVFKRRENIKNNNFTDGVDPTYLCSWLSGNKDGETKWVDRYYNPRIQSFPDALSGSDQTYYNVVTSASAQTTEVFDVSSSLAFEPNNDYAIYHIGSKDYEQLFRSYSKYDKTTDLEFLTDKNVPTTTNKVLQDKELVFDGGKYGKVTPNISGDFSVNMWLHTPDNSQPFGYLIAGNYFEEGFGIFNTDLVTPNIILPINRNTLLFLNNDFEVYDKVTLTDNGHIINIKGLARKDNFSEFYVLGENNIIYVFNSNNNLISKIENLKDSTATIDDWDVGDDRLNVLFNPINYKPNSKTDKPYFTYDINTNKASTRVSVASADTKGKKGKIIRKDCKTYIFEVDSENGFGNEIAFDSAGKAYTVRQSYPDNLTKPQNYVQKDSPAIQEAENDRKNIIKSGLGKRSTIHGVLVDDEDNIIVLHDNNIISILDNDRKLKTTREFCNLKNLIAQQSYIDLIYDFEDGVYKKYILFVQEFNDGFRLTKINEKLKIISTKRFYSTATDPFNLCDLKLTKTITSYSYLRKTGANKNRFKAVIKAKPKFSSTGIIPKDRQEIDFDISTLNTGYNHFFLNVSMRKGFMELYVNSKLYSKIRFQAGRYALDDVLGTGCYIGAVSTPFYLTFANRLLQPKKYFLKDIKIKGLKLYDKTMSYFEMLAHYNYHLGEKDLIWSYPLGQRTYIDTIDKLVKFTLPERINNNYRLTLNNTGIKDEKLKDKIKEKLNDEVLKLTPYYDKLDDIVIS